jgi:hypothetical protein
MRAFHKYYGPDLEYLVTIPRDTPRRCDRFVRPYVLRVSRAHAVMLLVECLGSTVRAVFPEPEHASHSRNA